MKKKLTAIILTALLILPAFTGCGEVWDYLPDIQVEEINQEIFVGEEADVKAQIIAVIMEQEKELTEKQREKAEEKLSEKLQEFQDTYSLEFEIPEESADILEWVEEGKTVRGLAPGNGIVNVRFADNGEDDPDKDKRDGGTVSITITVKEILPESITLSDKELTLTEGDEKGTTAEVTPENAGNKEVAYSSSNDEIATVDENGKIKAISPGEAEITVTAKGDDSVKETIKVTVDAIPEPDPEPVVTTNSSSSSNSKSSGSGSSGSTSKSSGSSGGSSKSSGGGSSSRGSSGSSGSGNNSGGTTSGTDHGILGGSIGGKNYDGKEAYEQGLKDLEKWEKENGIQR